MRETLLLLLLAGVNCTHIVDFMVLAPLSPQLLRIFSITPRDFSMVVACYAIAAGCTSLLGALFLDRFPRKRALVVLYAGFLLGTVGCGIAPTYAYLVAARLITGIFGGCLSALVLALVSDLVPAERRGRAVGVVMMGFSLASVIGVPLGLMLANHYEDWHAPFKALALFGVLLLGGLLAFLPNIPVAPRADKKRPIGDLLEGLSDRKAARALFVIPAFVLGQFTMIPFLSPYLVFNLGLPETQLPLMYFCGGMITLVASPFIGTLCDRFGSARVLLFSVPLSITPPMILANGLTAGVGTFAIIATMTFFFLSGHSRFLPATALVTKSVSPKHRGALMSLQSCLQQFSTGIASTIGGWVIVRGADGRLQHFSWLVYGSVLTSVLGLWLARGVKDRGKSKVDPTLIETQAA